MKNIALFVKPDTHRASLASDQTTPVERSSNHDFEPASDEAIGLIVKVIAMMFVTLAAVFLTAAVALKALVAISKISTKFAKKSASSYIQFS